MRHEMWAEVLAMHLFVEAQCWAQIPFWALGMGQHLEEEVVSRF
jgi:hypothetical protein